ncbi:MAG: 2-phospho-L-lactate guanylyltransferase [Acidimicrobiia bacterium]|nr:2-phospho-L-lactate guanylyltransferase [Acidimicrobiia bacterium]
MSDRPPLVSISPTAALLVPVKSFSQAKRRLDPALKPAEREALARAMAATVLRAAGGLRVAVVCDDDAVRVWAQESGAETIWTPNLGLNGAVAAGVAHLARRGVARVVVAHADLPLATDLAWLADGDGVTLVPDRHGDGTNVACVPAEARFAFAYGAGSFTAHRAEARRRGLIVRLVPDPALGWDVDVPVDLKVPPVLHPPAYLPTASFAETP